MSRSVLRNIYSSFQLRSYEGGKNHVFIFTVCFTEIGMNVKLRVTFKNTLNILKFKITAKEKHWVVVERARREDCLAFFAVQLIDMDQGINMCFYVKKLIVLLVNLWF